MKRIQRQKSKGASLIEYGLLAGLIAVVCIGTLQPLGNAVNQQFQTILNALGG